MAIKKLGDDPNTLKNGKAIHGLSLFPVEEMEYCATISQNGMKNS
jgi:hypothetical protein